MTAQRIPVPTLVRLEYLTANGWVVGHAAINLLNPGRYVERLLARGKLGRATEIDGAGQVWEAIIPEDVAARLADSSTAIPAVVCVHCSVQHGPPYDGMCLV